MKRIAIVIAVMVFASSVAFAAEQSPDRSQVKLSEVPRACLDLGTATKGGLKYTCTKVDTSEVWNELAVRTFNKDIFEAVSQREPTLIGLVVRQDSYVTDTQTIRVDRPEVAKVERRDGYKYSYSRR